MKFSKSVSLALLLGSLSFGAATASARPGYEGTLDAQLGVVGLSCNACHVGATSAATATTPIANTWKAGGNIATSDSDGDGFTNKQEAQGTALNFNDPAISPFISAANAETVAVIAGVNVIETGKGAAVIETAITDAYAQAGITVPAGSEVVNNTSPAVTMSPSTLTFRVGIPAGSTVYAVDLLTNTNTPIAAAFNATGSITVTGQNGKNIVVVRVTPASSSSSGGGKGGASVSGCMTTSITTPLMMLLTLLGLGLFVRRKQD